MERIRYLLLQLHSERFFKIFGVMFIVLSLSSLGIYHFERHGSETDVKSLFDALHPRDRSLLWLAYVEGYSHEEIAEMMGLNAKSVKVLLFRLRGSFAASLRSKGYGLEEQS